jgi:hypothetical protein
MLLVLVAGPVLRENIVALADKPTAWHWLRNIVARVSNFSDRMTAQETQCRGHLWPLVISSFALAICLQGGWLGSRQLIHSEFDPEKMPVAGVNFLQDEARSEGRLKQGQPPVFSTDSWGGYLIYRMYPERKVVVDDRHDLYGSDRVRQYLTLTQGEAGWQKVLKDWKIQTALLPADATLTNLLRELPQEWREGYGDKVAVVFLKHGKPPAANCLCGGYSNNHDREVVKRLLSRDVLTNLRITDCSSKTLPIQEIQATTTAKSFMQGPSRQLACPEPTCERHSRSPLNWQSPD